MQKINDERYHLMLRYSQRQNDDDGQIRNTIRNYIR